MTENLKLPIRDGMGSKSMSRNRYVPATRNETIQMMTECPASTRNRIIFLPNLDGVGFECRLKSGSNRITSLTNDQKIICALPSSIKEEVLASIRSINQQCYRVWQETKYQRQRSPMGKQNTLFKLTLAISFLALMFFFIFYQNKDIQEWFFHVCFSFIILCYTILVTVAIMICCRKNNVEDFDAKISNTIKDHLAKLNAISRNRLVWRSPRQKMWIYVTIPQELLPVIEPNPQ